MIKESTLKVLLQKEINRRSLKELQILLGKEPFFHTKWYKFCHDNKNKRAMVFKRKPSFYNVICRIDLLEERNMIGFF